MLISRTHYHRIKLLVCTITKESSVTFKMCYQRFLFNTFWPLYANRCRTVRNGDGSTSVFVLLYADIFSRVATTNQLQLLINISMRTPEIVRMHLCSGKLVNSFEVR